MRGMSMGMGFSGYGPGGSSYTLPAPTGFLSTGTSLSQTGGGLPVAQGLSFKGSRNIGAGMSALVPTLSGNKIRNAISWQGGLTSSTAEAGKNRNETSDNRDRATSDADRNPAWDNTGAAADADWNRAGSGAYSLITHPGNVVACIPFRNDEGNNYYRSAGTGNTPAGVRSITIGHDILDQFADKVVLLYNEIPPGYSTKFLEALTVAGTPPVATVANTSDFVGLLLVRDGNVVMTKVAGTPASADEYKETATGYEFYNGGGAPTTNNVWAVYSHGPITTVDAIHGVLSAWCLSEDAVFIHSAVNYGLPGALYGRNNVLSVDTFGAFDAGSGAAHRWALLDGVHPSPDGSMLANRTAAAVVDAAWPSAPSVAPEFVGGNYIVGQGNGSGLRLRSSGTPLLTGVALPAVLLPFVTAATAATVRIAWGATAGAGPDYAVLTDINGTKARISGAKIDTALDDNGGTGNTYTYATGHVDMCITTGNAPASGVRFVFEVDPTNYVHNGRFVWGENGTKTAGITGNPPKSITLAADNPTEVTVSQGTADADGFQPMVITRNGTLGGHVTITQSTNDQLLNRIVPAANRYVIAKARVKIRKGPNGHLYGLYGLELNTLFTHSATNMGPGYTAATSRGDGVGTGGSSSSCLTDYAFADGETEISMELVSAPILVDVALTGRTFSIIASGMAKPGSWEIEVSEWGVTTVDGAEYAS